MEYDFHFHHNKQRNSAVVNTGNVPLGFITVETAKGRIKFPCNARHGILRPNGTSGEIAGFIESIYSDLKIVFDGEVKNDPTIQV